MVEKQQTRFSDRELSLLKNTFAENDSLLKIIRKIFFQLGLSEQEEILARGTFNKDVVAILRKIYLPEIDGDAPLQQIVDLWAVTKIDDKEPSAAFPIITAKGAMIKYIDQQLEKVLDLDFEEKIKLTEYEYNEADNNLKTYCKLMARQLILAHTEQQLMQISILAGKKDETPDETIKRLQTNSNK